MLADALTKLAPTPVTQVLHDAMRGVTPDHQFTGSPALGSSDAYGDDGNIELLNSFAALRDNGRINKKVIFAHNDNSISYPGWDCDNANHNCNHDVYDFDLPCEDIIF